MNAKTPPSLEARVIRAAEAALADHQYVSPTDVLTGMGLLAPSHVHQWRRGLMPCLEEFIQGKPAKIARSMQIFRNWAGQRGLIPIEARYLARTRGPSRELQFTTSGDPDLEKAYRTHYVSPEVPEKRREKLREKLSQEPELVVFAIMRDSRCSKCKAELPHNSFILLEQGQPLCLTCADLDHLVYLPSGDTGLTRRARKYSSLSAVVVRFSRARKRYERQGILVEEAALQRAEKEGR